MQKQSPGIRIRQSVDAVVSDGVAEPLHGVEQGVELVSIRASEVEEVGDEVAGFNKIMGHHQSWDLASAVGKWVI